MSPVFNCSEAGMHSDKDAEAVKMLENASMQLKIRDSDLGMIKYDSKSEGYQVFL